MGDSLGSAIGQNPAKKTELSSIEKDIDRKRKNAEAVVASCSGEPRDNAADDCENQR